MSAYKKSNSGYLPFVQKEQVTSPYTDIVNRAKVDASLKTIFGVERIHVNSLNLLVKEQGPDGQPVYEQDNGDSRVRFVGTATAGFSYEGLVIEIEPESYAEVTFYGTGLNMVTQVNSFNRDFRISIDGGGEGANIFPQSGSGMITQRNYKPNQIIPVANGLTLDWHTIKIRYATGSSFGRFFGFEIVNESAQMTVKSGKAHGNGYEYLLDSDLLIDYNLGFDNIADIDVGTKGGRSIVYMDPANGLLKKRFTKVDVTPQYLTSTDHSNEAPYRVINWREFGRNRGDDFSTLTGAFSDRAFTLDDGTTTLVGDNVSEATTISGIGMDTLGSWVLTFVGTGLDIAGKPTTSGVSNTDILVDGVNVGKILNTNDGYNTYKICSGLPYGTHTVKFVRTSGNILATQDFIVYQPKKPSLPEGAIELGDYNIMADFAAPSAAGVDYIGTGVLRKDCIREVVYTGTYAVDGLQPDNFEGGLAVYSSAAGSTASYTFYGTGFSLKGRREVGYTDVYVDIDGESDFDTGIFGALTTSTQAWGFTSSTGLLDTNGAAQKGSSLSISGLPLGIHTVTFTSNQVATFEWAALDIITPIHSPHTTFGSRSIKDLRNFDSSKDVNKLIDFSVKKAFCSANQVLSLVDFSKGISQCFSPSGSPHVTIFYFEEPMSDEEYHFLTSSRGGSDFTIATIGQGDDQKKKHSITINNGNTSGSGEISKETHISIFGKQEKEELEE